MLELITRDEETFQIKKPNSEVALHASAPLTPRDRLISSWEQKGIILSKESNQFTRLINEKIIGNLGMPQGTECITVDTEESDAYYNPESRSIVLTRGMVRFLETRLAKIGIVMTEDHLAAIMAHEIEHANELGDTYNRDIKTMDWKRRLSSIFVHAEEYRADKQGMKRLAHAQYNPKAMIDFLTALGIDTDRGDAAHPEAQDRIRNIQNALVNDKDPIAHTSKPYIALDTEIKTWIMTDSEIYAKSEKLIRSQPKELAQALLETESQQDFWDMYKTYEHAHHVSLAKSFVEQDRAQLSRFTSKLIILTALPMQALSEEQEPNAIKKLGRFMNIERLIQKEKNNISPQNRESLNNITGRVARIDDESMRYRNSIIPSVKDDGEVSQASSRMNQLENDIDTIIQNTFDSLRTQGLSEDVTRNIQRMEEAYKTGQITEDIFRTAFFDKDQDYQEKILLEAEKEYRSKGLRPTNVPPDKAFKLIDPQIREHIMDTLVLDVALECVDLPDPTDVVKLHLAKLMQHETRMQFDACLLLSENILLNKDSSEWQAYLEDRDRQSLSPIIQNLIHLSDGSERLRLSPLRSLHKSFAISRSVEWDKKVKTHMHEGNDLARLDYSTSAARELYIRGNPAAKEWVLIDGRFPDLNADADLTLEEWNLVAESSLSNGTRARDEWVVKQFIANKSRTSQERSNSLDSHILAQAREVSNLPTTLSIEEIKILIDSSPWPLEKLKKLILANLERLPQKVDTSDEREQALEMLYAAYSWYNTDEPNTIEEIRDNDKAESLARNMVFLLVKEKEELGLPPNQALREGIIQVTQNGYSLYYGSLTQDNSIHGSELTRRIALLTDDDLTEVIENCKSHHSLNNSQTKFIEYFQLYAQLSPADRKIYRNMWTIPNQESVAALLANHSEQSVEWICKNFSSSELRDRLLIAAVDFAPDLLRQKFIDEAKTQFSEKINTNTRQSPWFDYGRYYYDIKLDEDPAEKYIGNSFLQVGFDDLLIRRYAFDSLAQSSRAGLRRSERFELFGSPYQRLLANELIKAEPDIFTDRPIAERKAALLQVAPLPSIVRDIYLEKLLRDEMLKQQTDQEKIIVGNELFPLFSVDSPLRVQLGTQLLRSEMRLNPSLLKNMDEGLKRTISYLSEPSLARNSFLTQLENSASLAPEQLRAIISLRLTEEGKKHKDDEAPMTYVFDKLSEITRAEKVKTMQWLLGLSPQKPLAIIEVEKRFDGHLNNLPSLFLASTIDEREVYLKRFFLGGEGIVDLETVPASHRREAENQRNSFIESLGNNLLPDTMQNAEIFRSIFTTVIESSDPSHASQLLTNLINASIEANISGKNLTPEEVVSLTLSELGVVGKKVSQRLAEQDWVPESFKKTLRQAQSEGSIVPKRALLTLAEDAGLLDVDSPIRIISFDELIGAASNKQACLLTVEIRDERTGLPKGIHKIVGKFKRPSAQKTENIDHDLNVLEKVLSVLQEKGYTDAFPPSFSEQIGNAIKRELDFTKEKEFSEILRNDLEKRNTLRRKRGKGEVLLPKILFSSDDLLLESRAAGISLKDYYDLTKNQYYPLVLDKYDMQNTYINEIEQTIAEEAIAEIIATGRIHADLHPGNIFIDREGNITFIDLGMHEELTKQQRLQTISLLSSLTTGNEIKAKIALSELGWSIGEIDLNFEKNNFAKNILELLQISQKTAVPPSEAVGAIILASSNLPTYLKNLDYMQLTSFLFRSLHTKDLPQVTRRIFK